MSVDYQVYAKPLFFGHPELSQDGVTITITVDGDWLKAKNIIYPEHAQTNILELLFKVTNAPADAFTDAEKAFIERNRSELEKLWPLSVGDVFAVKAISEGGHQDVYVCAPVGFAQAAKEAAKVFFALPYNDRVCNVFPAPKGFGTEPMKRKEFEVAYMNQPEVLLAQSEAAEA